MRVLYVGSGAVNLCLAGWMHSGTGQSTFLVRTPDNELIRTQAFQCRLLEIRISVFTNVRQLLL